MPNEACAGCDVHCAACGCASIMFWNMNRCDVDTLSCRSDLAWIARGF
ncbi:hypothetical protein [Lysobacter gummosus]